MWEWLRSMIKRRRAVAVSEQDTVLELQRTVQGLRLDLSEQTRLAESLVRELERQRSVEAARVAEAVASQIEELFTDVAAPAAQLLAQAHLHQAPGNAVQTRDVLAVSRRLLRALEDRGLTLEGALGDVVPFDPNRHAPLSGETTLVAGQPVVVRFPAAMYRGKVLRRAGVENTGG